MSLNPNSPKFRCNDCKFYAPALDNAGSHDTHGQCRRNAPHRADTYGVALWPIVTVDDWCGDGRKAGEQVAA